MDGIPTFADPTFADRKKLLIQTNSINLSLGFGLSRYCDVVPPKKVFFSNFFGQKSPQGVSGR
jgi:hypothetical protein